MKYIMNLVIVMSVLYGCNNDEPDLNLDLEKPYITSQVSTSSIRIFIGDQELKDRTTLQEIIKEQISKGDFLNEDSFFVPSKVDTVFFTAQDAFLDTEKSYRYSIKGNVIRLFRNDTIGVYYPTMQTLFGKFQPSYFELVEVPDFTNNSLVVERKIDEKYFVLEPKTLIYPLLMFRLYSSHLSINNKGSINNKFNEEFIKTLYPGDTLIIQEVQTSFQ